MVAAAAEDGQALGEAEAETAVETFAEAAVVDFQWNSPGPSER